jgi:hypothetical protein
MEVAERVPGWERPGVPNRVQGPAAGAASDPGTNGIAANGPNAGILQSLAQRYVTGAGPGVRGPVEEVPCPPPASVKEGVNRQLQVSRDAKGSSSESTNQRRTVTTGLKGLVKIHDVRRRLAEAMSHEAQAPAHNPEVAR